MVQASPFSLTATECQLIADEEALLERTLAAIDSAPRPDLDERSDAIAELRALRDAAMAAHEDDLPTLMHELSVRQALAARTHSVLPDRETPYLAHLVLQEGGQSRDYLLGHTNFFEREHNVRIVDWRVAPVAKIYYNYAEGDEYEEDLPGRTAIGIVLARRVVVVEKARVKLILTRDVALRHTQLHGWVREGRAGMSLSAGGSGHAAREGILGVGAGGKGRTNADVTALLDTEQFAAVTAPPDTALLVLGTAGSGKTTVALHRLARITHLQPKEFPLKDCNVIVPEEGLARLARRLLTPVGAKAEQVHTLDHWAVTLATSVFGRLPPRCSDAPGVVVSLKRHPALFKALREHFVSLKPAQITWRRLRRRLSELFSDRVFLSNVVERAHGTLPHSAVDATIRHTMLQLADPVGVQLAHITDPRMKQALDGQALDVGSAEELAGTIDLEELPIFLFLKAWRDEIKAAPLAHLVIDEAEDMSPFELYVLGTLLREPKSVTLAGDEAQQTHSSFHSWDFALECLGVPSAPICRLVTSYRCPRPVTEIAQRVLGHLASGEPIPTLRDGAAVGRFRFDMESQADLFVVESVLELRRNEPEASIAVVLHSMEAATRFHALFREPGDARLILEGDFGFDAGIDVTHVDTIKGLEFDYVVLPDVSAKHYPETDDARRRLHVAITRAAHQLWLVCAGEASRLVDWS